MLIIDDVTVRYGNSVAVQDISLAVERGEICAVLGPSGCGKTTLLYAVAGLLKPDEGRIIRGKDMASMSLIPQHYGLLPWKKAVDNVALSLIIKGWDKEASRLRAGELLKEMGLEDVASKYPGQMSGGQRQRVALARSLVFQPHLLLMDEPFSSLDQLTREELQGHLLRLHQAQMFTALLVTHSIEEAVFLGKRIVIMQRDPGKVKDVMSNPLWGLRDKRTSSLFYQACRDVRRCLEA